MIWINSNPFKSDPKMRFVSLYNISHFRINKRNGSPASPGHSRATPGVSGIFLYVIKVV